MALRFKGGNGPKLRNPQRSDVAGTVTHDVVTVQVSGGSTSRGASADAVYDNYTGATYYRGGKIYLEGFGNVEIQNLDPNVGSIATDGTITRITAGVMRLRINTGSVTIPLDVDLTDKTDELDQPMVFVSTVEGSLASHCQQQVDSRLAAIGGTPTMTANGLIFTTQNHATKTYVRNPNLWCSQVTPIDLSCISPWNSRGGVRRGGVFPTPQHFLNAAHYELEINDVVTAVDMNGVAHDRIIKGKRRHPNYVPYYPDLTLYTLDSPFPASIVPCELMPANRNDYLVNNFDNRPAALGLDQEEKALIIDYNKNGSFLTPSDATRLIFHEFKIGGDSGNPAGVIKDSKFVFITPWTYGGAGSGTPVAAHIPDLNQMIIDADAQAGISTGLTVTEADFSIWPNFTIKNYLIGDSGSGVKEAWVEDGTEEGRPKYRLQSNNILRALSWGLDEDTLTTGWRVLEGQTIGVPHPLVRYSDDFSADDVATPDLATFAGGYTFTNP